MNLDDVSPSEAKLRRVRQVLAEQRVHLDAGRKRRRVWIGAVSLVTVAGVATAGTAYFAPAKDVPQRPTVRCYYSERLSGSRWVEGVDGGPGYTLGPYVEEGMEPLPGQAEQVADPAAVCVDMWDRGQMNPEGVAAEVLPPSEGPSENNDFTPGHFVPELQTCVISGEVAVIPGTKGTCERLHLSEWSQQ